jgi:hypothetical protein
MKFDVREYSKMLDDNRIHLIYSGPIWPDGVDGIAEMLLKRLELEEMPLCASQSVFSIFVEQVNNMLMYSADKEHRSTQEGKQVELSKGIFIVGLQDKTYFIQSGNLVTDLNAELLKKRIDHLNTMDKQELRQFYKQQIHAEDNNPSSKGAGIGLIEIARRASGPIEYKFEQHSDGLKYFTTYVTVKQEGSK